MSRRLKYATFCSGIECMSVACRGLPLDPVFFSEIEPFPCAVLKANYPTIPNLGDMSKIRRDENGNITNGTTTIHFPDGGIDILAAGCPCQDFSVAGKRAGGAEGSGTRSSLIFEFIRIIGEIRPRWFIYENVVGMLSTNEGRDFAHILLAFRDCGYSVAYRTLDAQYVRVDGMERAVPQRRRRVWVVGCLGADESLAGKILFEPDCVAGHTAPRRRAGEGFAYSLAGRDRVDAPVVGGAPGVDVLNFQGSKGNNCVTSDGSCPNLNAMHGHDVHVVAQEGGGCLNPLDPQSKRIFTDSGVMQTLYAQAESTGQDSAGVCIALDGDKLKPREDQRKGGNGFGINEEGAGYTLTGVDCHGVAYGIGNGQAAEAPATIRECSQTLNCMHDKQATVQCYDMTHADDPGRKVADGVSPTLQSRMGTGGNQVPLAVSTNSNGGENGIIQSLGFKYKQSEKSQKPFAENGEAQALSSGCHDSAVALGFKVGQSKDGGLGDEREVSPTLSHKPSALEPTVAQSNIAQMRYIVRRLTPTECERLMGLPDGYTIPAGLDANDSALVAEFQRTFDTFNAIMAEYAHKKPPKPKTAAQVQKWLAKIADPATCPDSPRYKGCGNGWATNQPRWILTRLLNAEGIEW